MPKVATFRANSVIYFQGDASDRIFILQSGQVSLNYSDIETGKEVHDLIQTGEFFGVKSSLGKYPREDNALVLQDAQVLVLTVPEFEQLAMSNTRIILKMLKVFSNQLRRIHKQVENLLEKQEAASAEVGLFSTGEYYLRNRMYSQATYVLGRYLTYYPAGKLADRAGKLLEVAESAFMKYGDGKGPAPAMGGGGAAPPARATKQEAAKPAQGQTLSDTAKEYYNAVSLFSQEKFQDAFKEFKRIAESGEDPEYVPKAAFDMGRTLFMLGQYDIVIRHYTQMVQSMPKHPDLLDILFFLGQSYEKKGDTERAKGFYKKILSMEPDEDAATHMKSRRALKKLEGGGNG
ncbi:MAG: cyclic nucleotide-binding domain-containing protein [Spirochaetes bacterium]|nr:cyclic nucleotide-binding domain-containing protein [Spirochaetota bacterium]